MDEDAALERQLQNDLDVIRRYRELKARLASNSTVPASTATTTPVRRHKTSESLIGFVESSLRDWSPINHYFEAARAEYPKTTRAAVATALRRLVTKGMAEKRGNKADGVEFRRKDATKT